MAAHAAARVARESRAALLRGIYAIVDGLPVARAALGAGVRIVQYRSKRTFVAEDVRALRELTRAHGALLVLNDDWRAALEYDCDGVHLGPGDPGYFDVASVRAAMPDRLIGLSCATPEEARAADACDADYAGVGPVYGTVSKADAGEPIGIQGLRRVAAATRLPVAAIGGIGPHNLREVRRAGVAMAAVISALAAAADPEQAAAELVRCWNAP
jgi:thiamine-phosphate pyrophosphorylase